MIMPTYVFITILILISWLIFMSFVLIYSLLFKRMAYKIKSYKKILQYFSLYGVVLLMIILLFYWRYLRINYVLNLYAVYGFISNALALILPQDLIILTLLLLLIFIFSSLLVISFYARLKANALVLFIYYYQYAKFRHIYGLFLRFKGDFIFFLVNRVFLFTENLKALNIAIAIWPRGLLRLEKLIFIGLIPSLLLYDLFYNNAMLEKVFIVLPWFFLYSVLRTVFILLLSLYSSKNSALTSKLYGFKD